MSGQLIHSSIVALLSTDIVCERNMRRASQWPFILMRAVNSGLVARHKKNNNPHERPLILLPADLIFRNTFCPLVETLISSKGD